MTENVSMDKLDHATNLDQPRPHITCDMNFVRITAICSIVLQVGLSLSVHGAYPFVYVWLRVARKFVDNIFGWLKHDKNNFSHVDFMEFQVFRAILSQQQRSWREI